MCMPLSDRKDNFPMGKSNRLGGGGRFAKLKKKLGKRKGVKNAGALAAYIGRKKYGKKKFQSLARKGKRRKR